MKIASTALVLLICAGTAFALPNETKKIEPGGNPGGTGAAGGGWSKSNPTAQSATVNKAVRKHDKLEGYRGPGQTPDCTKNTKGDRCTSDNR